MKKQIFYLASAALAVGLAACSNELIEDEVSNITLQEGELAAAFEGVEQEDADTRVKLDGTDIVWDRDNGESIGVYGESLDSYYQYDLKNGTEDQTKAVFSVKNKNELPNGFKPTLAYYPWKAKPQNDVSGGTMLLTLESDIDYVPGAIDMPMVGKVSNGTINFTNTAALLKVTVVNMPAGKHYAKLSHKKKALSGAASIDLESTPYKLVMDDDEENYIKYNATATLGGITDQNSNPCFKAGETYDFYFVLPEGTYDKSLTFALGAYGAQSKGSETDDTGDATYSRALSIKRNTMYSTTLRYTDDASPVIESGNLAALNKQLANATGTASFTADLSKEKGIIYIPVLSDATSTITLNLTLPDGESNAITIKSASTNAEDKTPNVVVNVAQGVKTAATDDDAATYNDPYLDIELPKSVVTVAPASDAVNGDGKGKVTIKQLTANTYEDVLTIEKDVTVSTLKLAGKTNAYLADGAKIGTDVAATENNLDLYVFYETAESQISRTTKTDNTAVTLGNDDLYKLYYPVDNSTVTLKSAQNIAKEITISAGKTVTIDLATYTLSQSTASKSVIKVDGTLNIKGSTGGTISSTQSVPAIVVNAGGVVNLQSGVISNSAAAVVKVNGGTLNVTGGSLSGKTSEEAIDIVSGSATINTNTDATAENAVADVKGNVKVAAGGTFTLTSGYVSGTVAAEGSNSAGSEAAPATAATVNIEGGTLDGTSASALTLKAQAAYAPVNATIKGEGTVVKSDDDAIVLTGTTNTKPSLTIENGTISTSGSEKNVIKDATAAASIQIKGGVIKNATVSGKTETLQGTAINLASGSDLTITGGSVLAGATTGNAAIDLTKGSLDIPSTGDTVTLQGANVISATSTGNEVNISLANANATYTAGAYTANSTGYALFNYNAGTAKIGTLSISAGRFKGDIISSGKEFISGGHFSQCTNNLVNVAQGTYLKEGRILSYVVLDDNSDEYYEVVINSKK
jgi:hypothetical protein